VFVAISTSLVAALILAFHLLGQVPVIVGFQGPRRADSTGLLPGICGLCLTHRNALLLVGKPISGPLFAFALAACK